MPSPATPAQITQLRLRAYNDTTRAIEFAGISLTHDQADDLGGEVIDWLRSRLGLSIQSTDDGVDCVSDKIVTAETITNKQIRALCDEAGVAGDSVTVHICQVALGEEEPVNSGEAFEERYGGGGFDADEQRRIMDISSKDDAREACASVINAARAMED